MLHFAQDGSRSLVDKARVAVVNTRGRSFSERAESRKKFYEENASMAGVVTINQAEATYIDLNVFAFDQLSASIAEWANLDFGQSAIYKTREEYPIAVNVGNLAGGPPAVLFATAQTGVQVQPFQYFSKKFLVPNLVNAQFDLTKFKEKDVALDRVARDMALARQQYVFNTAVNQALNLPVATSIVNAYNVGASPWNGRTPYVLDPQVQSGSVVTTNNINCSAEGGLTKNVFQNIVDYCRLAPERGNDGATVPRAIFIPKAGTPWTAYWNQASIVAYAGGSNQDITKAIPQSKWEEAVNLSFETGGAYMNWFGTNVFVQPTNILPQGYTFLTTNKPAVLGWNQMDASVSNEGVAGVEQIGFNNRYEARSIALAQPDPLAPNCAIIKISS